MDEFDQYFNFGGGGETMSSKKNDETRGDDLKLKFPIEFMEAIKGVKQKIVVEKEVTCGDCKGTRADPESTSSRCSECGG